MTASADLGGVFPSGGTVPRLQPIDPFRPGTVVTPQMLDELAANIESQSNVNSPGVLATALAPITLPLKLLEIGGGAFYNNIAMPALAEVGEFLGIRPKGLHKLFGRDRFVDIDPEQLLSFSGAADLLGTGRGSNSFFKDSFTGKALAKEPDEGTFFTLLRNLDPGAVDKFKEDSPNLFTTASILGDIGINPLDAITGAAGFRGAFKARRFFNMQRNRLAPHIRRTTGPGAGDYIQSGSLDRLEIRNLMRERLAQGIDAPLDISKGPGPLEEIRQAVADKVRTEELQAPFGLGGEAAKDARNILNDFFGRVPTEDLFRRGLVFNNAGIFTAGRSPLSQTLSTILGESAPRAAARTLARAGSGTTAGVHLSAQNIFRNLTSRKVIRPEVDGSAGFAEKIPGISGGQKEALAELELNPAIDLSRSEYDPAMGKMIYGTTDGGQIEVGFILPDTNADITAGRRAPVTGEPLGAASPKGTKGVIYTASDGTSFRMTENALMFLAKDAGRQVARHEFGHVVGFMGRLFPEELRGLNNDYLSIVERAAAKLGIDAREIIASEDATKLIQKGDEKLLTRAESDAVFNKFDEWIAKAYEGFEPGSGGVFDTFIEFFRNLWRSLLGKGISKDTIFNRIESGEVFKRGGFAGKDFLDETALGAEDFARFNDEVKKAERVKAEDPSVPPERALVLVKKNRQDRIDEAQGIPKNDREIAENRALRNLIRGKSEVRQELERQMPFGLDPAVSPPERILQLMERRRELSKEMIELDEKLLDPTSTNTQRASANKALRELDEKQRILDVDINAARVDFDAEAYRRQLGTDEQEIFDPAAPATARSRDLVRGMQAEEAAKGERRVPSGERQREIIEEMITEKERPMTVEAMREAKPELQPVESLSMSKLRAEIKSRGSRFKSPIKALLQKEVARLRGNTPEEVIRDAAFGRLIRGESRLRRDLGSISSDPNLFENLSSRATARSIPERAAEAIQSKVVGEVEDATPSVLPKRADVATNEPVSTEMMDKFVDSALRTIILDDNSAIRKLGTLTAEQKKAYDRIINEVGDVIIDNVEMSSKSVFDLEDFLTAEVLRSLDDQMADMMVARGVAANEAEAFGQINQARATDRLAPLRNVIWKDHMLDVRSQVRTMISTAKKKPGQIAKVIEDTIRAADVPSVSEQAKIIGSIEQTEKAVENLITDARRIAGKSTPAEAEKAEGVFAEALRRINDKAEGLSSRITRKVGDALEQDRESAIAWTDVQRKEFARDIARKELGKGEIVDESGEISEAAASRLKAIEITDVTKRAAAKMEELTKAERLRLSNANQAIDVGLQAIRKLLSKRTKDFQGVSLIRSQARIIRHKLLSQVGNAVGDNIFTPETERIVTGLLGRLKALDNDANAFLRGSLRTSKKPKSRPPRVPARKLKETAKQKQTRLRAEKRAREFQKAEFDREIAAERTTLNHNLRIAALMKLDELHEVYLAAKRAGNTDLMDAVALRADELKTYNGLPPPLPNEQPFNATTRQALSKVDPEAERIFNRATIEAESQAKLPDSEPPTGGSNPNLRFSAGEQKLPEGKRIPGSDNRGGGVIAPIRRPRPATDFWNRMRSLFQDPAHQGRVWRQFLFNFDDVTAPIWSRLAGVVDGFTEDVIETTKLGVIDPENNPLVLYRTLLGHGTRVDQMLFGGMLDARTNQTLLVIEDAKNPGKFINSSVDESAITDADEVLSVPWMSKVLDHSTTDNFMQELNDATEYMLYQRYLEKKPSIDIFGGDRTMLDRVKATSNAIRTGDQARFARIRQFTDRYRHFMEQSLEYSVARGMLSETEKSRILATNKFYVDAHRDMGFEAGDLSYTKPSDTPEPSSAFNKITGSRRAINNLFTNTFNQMREVMYQADLNEFNDAMFSMIEKSGDTSLARKLRVVDEFDDTGHHTARAFDDSDLSQVDLRIAQSNDRKDGVHKFRRKGRVVWFKVEDPEFVQSMNEMFKATLFANNEYAKAFKFFSKDMIQKMVTLSPQFIIRNAPRDFLFQFIVNPFDVDLTEFIKETGRAWKASPEMQRRFELSGAGQATLGSHMNDPQTYYNAMDKAVKNLRGRADERNIITDWKGVQGMTKGVIGWLENASAKSEGIGRIRQYNIALKRVDTISPNALTQRSKELFAGFSARDIMDFGLAGKYFKEFGPFVPFLRASVRGFSKTAETLGNVLKGKTGSRRAFGQRMFQTLILPELMLYAVNKATGSTEQWQEQDAVLKDMFWSLRIGTNTWLRIPKPFELGVLSSGVGRLINVADGNDFRSAFDGWGMSVLTGFSPVDTGTILGPARTAVELLTNKDMFRGRYIVSPFEEGLDVKLRPGAKTASKVGQVSAGLFNFLSPWDADPRQIDFLIRRQFGGFGKILLGSSDMLDPDKSVSTARGLDSFLGVFAETPGPFAVSTQRAQEAAARVGKLRSTEFNKFRRLRRQIFRPGLSAEQKEQAARRIVGEAKLLLRKIDRPSVFQEALRQAQERERKRRSGG